MIKIIDKFTKDSLMKLRLWNLLPHDYAPFFRILHIIVISSQNQRQVKSEIRTFLQTSDEFLRSLVI